MPFQKDLQKPEESVRRPAILDDTVLLSELDNDLREILAEIDPTTIADSLNAVVSQIRQILYGLRNFPTDRWSDLPSIGLVDLIEVIEKPWGLSKWVAGDTIEKGQIVYAGPEDNTVHLASSIDLLHTNIVGMAFESKADGEDIKIAHNGRTIDGFTGLVPGQHYFLQYDGTIGSVNPTPARGTFTLRAGIAKTNSTLLINIGEPRVRP